MKKGFTLIELLVVIAIIALLSSVVLASLNSARDKAKIAQVRTQVDQIYKAFRAAALDANSDYLNKSDTTGQNLSDSTVAAWYVPVCDAVLDYTTGDDRPNGEYARQFATAINTYIKNIPLDPWGSPYWIDSVYTCTAGEPSIGCVAGNRYFVIGSGGPNKSLPNNYDSDNVVVVYCKQP